MHIHTKAKIREHPLSLIANAIEDLTHNRTHFAPIMIPSKTTYRTTCISTLLGSTVTTCQIYSMLDVCWPFCVHGHWHSSKPPARRWAQSHWFSVIWTFQISSQAFANNVDYRIRCSLVFHTQMHAAFLLKTSHVIPPPERFLIQSTSKLGFWFQHAAVVRFSTLRMNWHKPDRLTSSCYKTIKTRL